MTTNETHLTEKFPQELSVDKMLFKPLKPFALSLQICLQFMI